MKRIIILAALAAVFIAGPALYADQDEEYQIVRSTVVAIASRHPDPAKTRAAIDQVSSSPAPHLMALAADASERSYIRAAALDLLTAYAAAPGVLEFLEERISDVTATERKVAIRAYARGFHASHRVRVEMHLIRCASSDPDRGVGETAARVLLAAQAGELKPQLSGDYRQLKR